MWIRGETDAHATTSDGRAWAQAPLRRRHSDSYPIACYSNITLPAILVLCLTEFVRHPRNHSAMSLRSATILNGLTVRHARRLDRRATA